MRDRNPKSMPFTKNAAREILLRRLKGRSIDGWMDDRDSSKNRKVCCEILRDGIERKARKLYHAPSLTRSVFTCVNLVFNVTPPMPVEASNKVSVVLRSQRNWAPFPNCTSSEFNCLQKVNLKLLQYEMYTFYLRRKATLLPRSQP